MSFVNENRTAFVWISEVRFDVTANSYYCIVYCGIQTICELKKLTIDVSTDDPLMYSTQLLLLFNLFSVIARHISNSTSSQSSQSPCYDDLFDELESNAYQI